MIFIIFKTKILVKSQISDKSLKTIVIKNNYIRLTQIKRNITKKKVQ